MSELLPSDVAPIYRLRQRPTVSQDHRYGNGGCYSCECSVVAASHGISQLRVTPRSSATASTEFGGNTVPGIDTSANWESADQERNGKRLLLITPFSPLREHGHAADDLGRNLVEALASRFELHVYAPGQREANPHKGSSDHVTYHSGSRPRGSALRHLAWYPAGLRKDWARENSREVRKLIEKCRPDFVHIEYLQGVESVMRKRTISWSITLHDITSKVFKQRAAASTGLERIYRWAEYARVRSLERRVVRNARHVFTLSAMDAVWVREVAPTRAVSHVRIGMDIPAALWTPVVAVHPTFVFAGAMWRESNVAAAEWLANQVMPIVWQECPTAILRIVGARPTARVVGLAADSRIEVVGRVDSIEKEYLGSTAVLAPTLVDAGVLLKALRGLACGVPLILNSAAAKPLEVEDGVQCYVRDTADSMANQMLDVWKDSRAAQLVASAGATFVHKNFSWVNYGNEMVRGIDG